MKLFQFHYPRSEPTLEQPAHWCVSAHVHSMCFLLGAISSLRSSPYGDETVRAWSLYVGPCRLTLEYLETPRSVTVSDKQP